MMEIIGVSGKAGKGKDFVGRTVLRPAGFSQWAFAWPMKMLCMGQFGRSYKDVFETKPPEVRRELQVIGTEEGWMRFGKEYWLVQAEGWLTTMRENLGIEKFYFTDVRFPHEVAFIHYLGGKVVRIEGNRPTTLTGEAAQHSSETALDDYTGWDCVVPNDLDSTPSSIRWHLESAGILPTRMAPSIGEFIEHAIPITRSQEGVLGRHLG